jgi:predicted  nucleic acid-binding Zn-ribbon protein
MHINHGISGSDREHRLARNVPFTPENFQYMQMQNEGLRKQNYLLQSYTLRGPNPHIYNAAGSRWNNMTMGGFFPVAPGPYLPSFPPTPGLVDKQQQAFLKQYQPQGGMAMNVMPPHVMAQNAQALAIEAQREAMGYQPYAAVTTTRLTPEARGLGLPPAPGQPYTDGPYPRIAPLARVLAAGDTTWDERLIPVPPDAVPGRVTPTGTVAADISSFYTVPSLRGEGGTKSAATKKSAEASAKTKSTVDSIAKTSASIKDFERELGEMRSKLEKASGSEATDKATADKAQTALDAARQSVKKATDELGTVTKEEQEAVNKIAALKKEIEKRQGELDATRKELKRKFEAASKIGDPATLEGALKKLETDIDALTAEHDAAAAKTKAEIALVNGSLDLVQARVKKAQAQVDKMEAAMTIAETQYDAAAKSLKSTRSSVADMQKQISELQKKIEAARKAI